MQKHRRSLVGRVIGDKMDKTVVVLVESLRPHPLYRKTMKRRKKVKAHCENNDCKVGDMVRIQESRPISKTKHWRVSQVLAKGQVVEPYKDDTAADQT